MRSFIKLSVLMVGLGMVTGCKKFLKEKAFTNLNASIFPKTEGDLRVLCNGLYNLFEVNEHYGRSHVIISDVFSDELSTTALSGPRYEMQTFQITPGNTELAMRWSRNYIIIARANIIIQQAPLTGLPEAATNKYVAEAKFIRAHCYFEQTSFFGDVPLILEQPINIDSLQKLKPSRTPQRDVYRQIVEDLKYAEQYLPRDSAITAGYKGTASNGAATSLLAKVYLTRAYLPFAEAGDFQNAAAACAKVIASNQYDLMPAYADVFDIRKENGKEHIFSIQYDQAPNRTGGITGFLIPAQVYPFCFGVFPVERAFYDAFPATDSIRKKYVFFDQGVGLTGVAYNFIATPTSQPFCAKYRDDELALKGFNDRCNYLILRFADVLLMHSEALNRINPADNNKYNGINRVRARVKQAALSGLDQSAFETAILNERNWEFCFEGKRRDDLIRLGKLVPVMTALGKINIRAYHKFYPVPQSEIDINPNLKPQNEGYAN